MPREHLASEMRAVHRRLPDDDEGHSRIDWHGVEEQFQRPLLARRSGNGNDIGRRLAIGPLHRNGCLLASPELANDLDVTAARMATQLERLLTTPGCTHIDIQVPLYRQITRKQARQVMEALRASLSQDPGHATAASSPDTSVAASGEAEALTDGGGAT